MQITRQNIFKNRWWLMAVGVLCLLPSCAQTPCSCPCACANDASNISSNLTSARQIAQEDLPLAAAPMAQDTTYFFLVDRFANGDKKNDAHPTVKHQDVLKMQGGDWAGVLKELKY
ncbi:MAG: hypothetical protein J6Y94_06610 [Bacteriovoracaceae bacterium]|nr:hypothetical protein [Bacteriovoracaceae bacterium]